MTSASAAAPTVTWNPTTLIQTIAQGESATVELNFSASENLSNVVIHAVPALQQYVQITPTQLIQVTAGQTITVTLAISVPESQPVGTIDGTLQIRAGKRNSRIHSTPLAVILSIIEGQQFIDFVNDAGGYQISVPTDWQAGTDSGEPDFTFLLPPGRSTNPDLEYFADIVVDSAPNPDNLNLADFYQQVESFDLFENSAEQTFFDVDGFEAVRFESVLGMVPTTVVAVRLDSRIIEITNLSDTAESAVVFARIVQSLSPVP